METDFNKSLSIDSFLSRINARPLLRTNKFLVQFGSNPNLPLQVADKLSDAKFYCDSVEFPSRALQATDFHIYGPSFKAPVFSAYTEVNMTLLCDISMGQKTAFDDWMEFINPSSTFDMEYRDSYVVDTTISALDDRGQAVYSSVLYESFPLSVGALPSNWVDDNYHRIQIGLTYRYWKGFEHDLRPNLSPSVSTKP